MNATCDRCGKPVHINPDNTVVRECEHKDAAIKVNLSATLYGEADLMRKDPKALELAKTG